MAQQMARALGMGSRSEFLKATVTVAEKRIYHAPVLTALYELLYKAITPVLEESTEECVALLRRRFSKERLLEMANTVITQQKKIVYNVNGNLFFTALCSELLPRT